ncbi:MAG: polysaccharide biosynthesis/export family protein [Candidatus Binatia bacterium]
MTQSRGTKSRARIGSCALWALALFIFWGCGAPITVLPLVPEEIPRIEAAGNYPHIDYHIEPGDTVKIGYIFHPEMNQEDIVRPDGKITANLVGEMNAAGLTPVELEQLLKERTSSRLRDPEVKVTISNFAVKEVYVTGEVGKPGKIIYRKGLTPLQAVAEAGGFLDTARVDSIILVRPGESAEDFVSRKINLEEVVTTGVKEPIHLAPHDVLFIPKTPIANANVWVRQHITDMLTIGQRAIPAPRP